MQNISSLMQKMQADCNATKIADPERFIVNFILAVRSDNELFEKFMCFMNKVHSRQLDNEVLNEDHGFPCTTEDIVRMSTWEVLDSPLSKLFV